MYSAPIRGLVLDHGRWCSPVGMILLDLETGTWTSAPIQSRGH
jgi:hypothetical protein